ncbi:MAG: DUF4157 domain-containing protein [Deltaproteobacteria bacterium]|nr:DUF4157 domain-containing protein [Deltaproteobacteria bacterium]
MEKLLNESGRRAAHDTEDDLPPQPGSPGKLRASDLATQDVVAMGGDAIAPGKVALVDADPAALTPEAALAYARWMLERRDRPERAERAVDGTLASAFAFLDAPARTTRDPAVLARSLVAADARAVREMLAQLVQRAAPISWIDDLLAHVPPHVAGPALGLPPRTPPAARPFPRGPGPALAAACERRAAGIYRDAHTDDADRDHPAVRTALDRRRGGGGLPAAQRAAMEERLGADFARVRIHTDAVAAEACRALGANAFTIGEDIFFAGGAFTADNDELLAHELAHVVQAQEGRTAAGGVSHRDDPLEQEARHAATRAVAPARPQRPEPGPSAPAPTSAMILRDEAKEIDYLADEWLKAEPFAISYKGQLTSEKRGESVKVRSPVIEATSKVSLELPKDKKLGDKSVKFGPIQTLLSSNRIAVYEKDGQRTEEARTMNQTRDAAEGTYEAGAPAFAPTEAPFYSGNPDPGANPDGVAGSKLSDWSGSGNTFTGVVRMIDRPGAVVPTHLPDGKVLVALKGSDEFNTSAGFKVYSAGASNQRFGLAPFGWSLSWETPIAADGTATPDPKRDAITKKVATEAIIEDTKNYANLFARFDSLDAALRESPWTLLQLLPEARKTYPRGAGFITQALGQRPPQFKVTVKAIRGAGQKDIGKDGIGDDVTMLVSGTITKIGPSTSVTARQNVAGVVKMSFGDMADAGAVTESSVLNVVVHEEKHLGGGTEIPFPFLGKASIGQGEGSEGEYTVQVESA